jgi:ribosomal protein S18 acetylase RimI-like enzyme
MDEVFLRRAVPGDSAKAVPLIMQAIGEIAYILSGTPDPEETATILDRWFVRGANRISFENTLVLEEEGEVVGLVISYDGAKARAFDKPIEKAASLRSGDLDYWIPLEAEESEFYLDTVSVSPKCQGRGYGSKLIETACDWAATLGAIQAGLVVEVENTSARRLYERLGFSVDFTKKIGGHDYFYMTKPLQ